MTSSLSNLDNNLSERLHRTKFILRYDNKIVKHVELSMSIATVFSNVSKMMYHRWLCCNKSF